VKQLSLLRKASRRNKRSVINVDVDYVRCRGEKSIFVNNEEFAPSVYTKGVTTGVSGNDEKKVKRP